MTKPSIKAVIGLVVFAPVWIGWFLILYPFKFAFECLGEAVKFVFGEPSGYSYTGKEAVVNVQRDESNNMVVVSTSDNVRFNFVPSDRLV